MHKMERMLALVHKDTINDEVKQGICLGVFEADILVEMIDVEKPNSTFLAQRIVGSLPIAEFCSEFNLVVIRVDNGEVLFDNPVNDWLISYRDKRGGNNNEQ